MLGLIYNFALIHALELDRGNERDLQNRNMQFKRGKYLRNKIYKFSKGK